LADLRKEVDRQCAEAPRLPDVDFKGNSGASDPDIEPLDDRELKALRELQPGGHVVLGGGAGAECIVERVS